MDVLPLVVTCDQPTDAEDTDDMMPSRIPREQIPWYPTVDLTRCTGDQACVTFCKREVFTWDPTTERPVVAKPYNCVVGCSGCTSICTPGAIGFPTLEWLGEFLEKLREGTCGCS
jgi:NAD-dependent dihydropyrimidine dehydrogenase PreA subunit